jgi:hypothetical protein
VRAGAPGDDKTLKNTAKDSVIPAGGQGRKRRLLNPRSTRPLSGDASRGDERAVHLIRNTLHGAIAYANFAGDLDDAHAGPQTILDAGGNRRDIKAFQSAASRAATRCFGSERAAELYIEIGVHRVNSLFGQATLKLQN